MKATPLARLSRLHGPALAVLLAGCATGSLAQSVTVSISGGVRNYSTWRNDPSTTPPNFYVPGDMGSPTSGYGRAMLGIYAGTSIGAAPVSTVYLHPTNIFDLAPLPMGVGNWLFTFEGMSPGQTYTLAAWIDGNDNRSYDVGEPVGTRQVQAVGDSLGNVVSIRDDSDGDGLEDWWEVYWFDNLAETANSDYDNDGLSNGSERMLISSGYPSLNPSDWDSDDDRMDDGWEYLNALNPVSPSGNDGAAGDQDSDTLNNLFEYRGPDGIGPRYGELNPLDTNGRAVISATSDTMDPNSRDTDDDGVDDNVEVLVDLTHPVHSMSSTNIAARSLRMNVNAQAGVPLTDPAGNTFAFGQGGGTVEFWMYPETNTASGWIYYFPTAGTGVDHFRISLQDRRPKMEIMTGTTVFTTVGGSSVEQLPINRWSHVAFAWAPDNNSLELYVDGVLLIAQKTFIKPNFTVGPPSILKGFAGGFIDELRVWDYARTAADIDHWARRIYPAPGYPMVASLIATGDPMANYEYGIPLLAYYRFDDAGETVENFAHLSDRTYALPHYVATSVTTDQAVNLFGSDDADGDGLPEWWVSLHNLDQYQEYYAFMYGPYYEGCVDDPSLILDFKYFRTFTAYASVGNAKGWVEDPEAPGAKFHTAKSIVDFYEGVHSAYTKYIYLDAQPRECRLETFTPAMVSTIVYVNGERVTPEGEESNTSQSYDVASKMRLGRNMVYVRCESEYTLESVPSSYFGTFAEYEVWNPGLADFLGCNGRAYQFKRAVGKFDARLTCNGAPVIVRGDETRADPRSVWHCQTWSVGQELYGDFSCPVWDKELRALPGNQDYGLPADAERDNNPLDPDFADDFLDANHEFICGTNPRDRDSDNDGVSDGTEDFDLDGLVNSSEQSYGSDPWLPDSDDDGVLDGQDIGSRGHPAQSISPVKNLAVHLGGTTNDYIEFPKQARFELTKWTVESWVKLDAGETNGCVLVHRSVAANAVNYEMGLGNGGVAPVNVPYVRFVANVGTTVLLQGSAPVPTGTWTHVAASFYNGDLKLFVGGTNVAAVTATVSPAVHGGGPIVQRIGEGLEGSLDEVRIWGTPRTVTELISNRDDVLTGLENSLIAYYRFDDSTSYRTNGLLGVVGTSANNGANGSATIKPWDWGQIEDFRAAYAADWNLQWLHAATARGAVTYTTDAAVLGPPQLQVFIEPDDAIQAGAQWSYNGGASWNDSGFLETHLSPGTYGISFNMLDGWIEPDVTNVVLQRGTVTVLAGRYTRTASLTVTLINSQTIRDTARWTVDGGLSYHKPGERIDNLTPNVGLDIIFTDISAAVPGYDTPDTISVTLGEGEHRVVTSKYEPIVGSVQVRFTTTAVQGSARWQISGYTNWWQSGSVVSNLSYGIHTIVYNIVDGWESPPSEQVAILDNGLTSLSRAYTKIPEPTSVKVFIQPAEAVSLGAKWALDGGAWLPSGAFALASVGSHTVSFNDIDGWFSPASVSVTVSNGAMTRITNSYYEVRTTGQFGTGNGEFKYPRGLAVRNNRLYVTDSGNHRIQVFDVSDPTNMAWVATYGGTAAGAAAGSFNQPYGVTVDAAGDIWVADTGNHRIQRRSTSSGTWTAWGSQGSTSGKFNAPYDLAVDSAGAVYVADHHNSRIQKLVLPSSWTDFIPNDAQNGWVLFPNGIAIDSTDNVFVTDYDAAGPVHRLRKFDSSGDLKGTVGSADADRGGLQMPTGVSFGTNETELLVVSRGSGKVHLGRLTNGVSAVWSTRLRSGILSEPHDVVVDEYGNVYVADTGNHRIVQLVVDDADSDGMRNAQERVAGTNPFNATSFLYLKAQTTGDGSGWRVVSWPSVTGRVYTVSVTSNGISSSWSGVPTCSAVPGTGSEMHYTNKAPLVDSEFYRVRVERTEE